MRVAGNTDRPVPTKVLWHALSADIHTTGTASASTSARNNNSVVWFEPSVDPAHHCLTRARLFEECHVFEPLMLARTVHFAAAVMLSISSEILRSVMRFLIVSFITPAGSRSKVTICGDVRRSRRPKRFFTPSNWSFV
jgi:hypothetical protein